MVRRNDGDEFSMLRMKYKKKKVRKQVHKKTEASKKERAGEEKMFGRRTLGGRERKADIVGEKLGE